MKEKQARVQYRYYETPPNTHILPLLGTGWIREYGNDINELHFHNCLEIGYCHDGAGTMTFGEKKIPYRGGMFSVVPPNYLHTTNSLVGRKCRWEYLFVDVEGFLTEMYPANQQMSRLLAKKIHSGAALVNHEENAVTADLSGSDVAFDQFAAGKLAYSMVDGKNYGVPFDNGAAITCLRTDVLEQAGHTVDEFTDISWEQFITLAKDVLHRFFR